MQNPDNSSQNPQNPHIYPTMSDFAVELPTTKVGTVFIKEEALESQTSLIPPLRALNNSDSSTIPELPESKLRTQNSILSETQDQNFVIKKEVDVKPDISTISYNNLIHKDIDAVESTNVSANSEKSLTKLIKKKIMSNRAKVPTKRGTASDEVMATWAAKHNQTLRKKTPLIRIGARKSLSNVPKSQLMLKLERLKAVPAENILSKRSLKQLKPAQPRNIKIKSESLDTESSDFKPPSSRLIKDKKPYISPYIDPIKKELISEQDYKDLELEAFMLWKSQRKDTESPYKKRNDIAFAFANGCLRDKIKVVILNYLDMIEELPVILAIYQQRDLLLKSGQQNTTDVDKALASCLKWVKAKCVLLVSSEAELAEIIDLIEKTHTPPSTFLNKDTKPSASKLGSEELKFLDQLDDCIETILDKCTIFSTDIAKTVQILSVCKKSQSSLVSLFSDSALTIDIILHQLLGLYSILPPDFNEYIKKHVLEAYWTLDLQRQLIFCNALAGNYSHFGIYLQLISSYSAKTHLLHYNPNSEQTSFDLLKYHTNMLCAIFSSKDFPWADPKFESTLNRSNINEIQGRLQQYITDLVKSDVLNLPNKQWYNFAKAWCGLLGFSNCESNERGFSLCIKLARISKNYHESKICLVLAVLLANCSSPKSTNVAKEMLLGLLNTNSSVYFSLFVVLLFFQKVDEAENLLCSLSGIPFSLVKKKLYYLRDLLDSRNDSSTELYQKALTNVVSKSNTLKYPDSKLAYKALLIVFRGSSSRKLNIDVSSWLINAIKSANLSNLPDLFDLIKQSIDSGYNHIPESDIKPILHGQVLNTISMFSDFPTTISHEYMLVLFYVLYFNKKYSESSSTTSISTFNSIAPQSLDLFSHTTAYSDELIDLVPAKLVLTELEKYRVPSNKSVFLAYKNVLPEYLSLLITQYQYQIEPAEYLYQQIKTDIPVVVPKSFYSPDQKLDEKGEKALISSIKLKFNNLCFSNLESVNSAIEFIASYIELPSAIQYSTAGLFVETSLHNIMVALSDFSSKNLLSAQVKPVNIIQQRRKDSLGYLMTTEISENSVNGENDNALISRVVRQFFAAWDKLYNLNPTITAMGVVNALLVLDKTSRRRKYTIQELWADPLVVFNCNSCVFMHLPLVTVFLVTLNFFLAMSRSKYITIFENQLKLNQSLSFKRENLNSLLQLQESSAIQMLTEVLCLCTKNSFLNNDETTSNLVKNSIYEFIHQKFIDQKLMLKLICFETYDRSLIREMVVNVPSIHASSDFLPELIIQPCAKQMLFGVELAGYLFELYPLLKNETMAREVLLPHISNSIKPLISGKYTKQDAATTNILITTLLRTAMVFPTLSDSSFITLEAFQKECIFLLRQFANSRKSPFHQTAESQGISKLDDISAFRCQLINERIDGAISILGAVRASNLALDFSNACKKSNIRTSTIPKFKSDNEIKTKTKTKIENEYECDTPWELKNDTHSSTFLCKYSEESYFVKFLSIFTTSPEPPILPKAMSKAPASLQDQKSKPHFQHNTSTTAANTDTNFNTNINAKVNRSQAGPSYGTTSMASSFSANKSNSFFQKQTNREPESNKSYAYPITNPSPNHSHYYQDNQNKNFQQSYRHTDSDSVFNNNKSRNEQISVKNDGVYSNNTASTKNTYAKHYNHKGDGIGNDGYLNSNKSKNINPSVPSGFESELFHRPHALNNKKRNASDMQSGPVYNNYENNDKLTKNWHAGTSNISNKDDDSYQYKHDTYQNPESSKSGIYKGTNKRKASQERIKDVSNESYKKRTGQYNQKKNQGGQGGFGGSHSNTNLNTEVGGHRPRQFKDRNNFKQQSSNKKNKFKFNKSQGLNDQ